MYQTINGWTKQGMINHIRVNFKGKSAKRNPNEIESCLYRGPEGKKCAVGMFIPDEEYVETMEGNTASEVIREFPIIVLSMPLVNKGLNDLQRVHDNSPSSWPDSKLLEQMVSWVEDHVED